jgi:hypothetical protein
MNSACHNFSTVAFVIGAPDLTKRQHISYVIGRKRYCLAVSHYVALTSYGDLLPKLSYLQPCRIRLNANGPLLLFLRIPAKNYLSMCYCI